MGSLVAFAVLFSGIFLIVKFATRHATFPERAELAALRALVDRIDTLADEGRDIKQDPQANDHLSVQILDEIRAHRRRADATHFQLAKAERSTPLTHIVRSKPARNR